MIAKISLSKYIGPFNADRQLKRELAVSFWKDSFDLRVRAKWSLDNLNIFRKSMLAKIYVDLIMSIECSLKSLIISLSRKNETPETAYLCARDMQHQLLSLYNEVKNRAKRRAKLLSKREFAIINKANLVGVRSRYDVSIVFVLYNESLSERTLGGGIISSTINLNFVHQLRAVAIRISNLADIAIEKYFKKDSGLVGSNLGKLDARFEKFYSSMKLSKKI